MAPSTKKNVAVRSGEKIVETMPFLTFCNPIAVKGGTNGTDLHKSFSVWQYPRRRASSQYLIPNTQYPNTVSREFLKTFSGVSRASLGYHSGTSRERSGTWSRANRKILPGGMVEIRITNPHTPWWRITNPPQRGCFGWGREGYRY